MIKKIFISALPMLIVFLFDNILNIPLGFYDQWRWFDIPMHVLGGVVTCWSCHRLYEKIKNEIIIKSFLVRLWLYISTTAFIGILWEVYEFSVHIMTGIVTQPSVADTVDDLVNDLIGAALFCLFVYFNHRDSLARR